jgi:hypothetical protein
MLEQSMFDTLRLLRKKSRMLRALAAKNDINRPMYLVSADDCDADAKRIKENDSRTTKGRGVTRMKNATFV